MVKRQPYRNLGEISPEERKQMEANITAHLLRSLRKGLTKAQWHGQLDQRFGAMKPERMEMVKEEMRKLALESRPMR